MPLFNDDSTLERLVATETTVELVSLSEALIWLVESITPDSDEFTAEIADDVIIDSLDSADETPDSDEFTAEIADDVIIDSLDSADETPDSDELMTEMADDVMPD